MADTSPMIMRRAGSGAAAGVVATGALTAFRLVLNRMGLVFDTAPQLVVRRLYDLRLLPSARNSTMAAVAHVAYGVGAGTVCGLLRRRCDGPVTEVAVGTTLGILVWGSGWSMWLPLLGVEPAPWNWRGPAVVLPVIDHAVYGAVWGTTYWMVRAVVSRADTRTAHRA